MNPSHLEPVKSERDCSQVEREEGSFSEQMLMQFQVRGHPSECMEEELPRAQCGVSWQSLPTPRLED